MIDISKSHTIQGWMTVNELTWLATQAQGRQFIIEVGSWRGKSARAIADNTQGLVLCVDHFKGTKPDVGQDFAHSLPGGVLGEFYDNLADHILSGHVIPVIAASQDGWSRITSIWGTECADMVFIDADHSYEAAKGDIVCYRELLRDGGILCGHDYSRDYPGVIRAVDELLPGFRRGPDSIWLWEKSG